MQQRVRDNLRTTESKRLFWEKDLVKSDGKNNATDKHWRR